MIGQSTTALILGAYMLMQAKHRKYPEAARKYAERIAEHLDGSIPDQVIPLLNAALEESDYEPNIHFDS